MAISMAASVAGLIGIHLSARTAVDLLYLGSTAMILTPASFARFRCHMFPVS